MWVDSCDLLFLCLSQITETIAVSAIECESE